MRDTEEESFPQLVSRVVDDAKEVARAEFDLVKAQAVAKVAGYRAAAILLAVAVVMGVAAAIALVVGLLLIAAACVGPVWATLIVTGATLLLAALCGWLGFQRIKRA